MVFSNQIEESPLQEEVEVHFDSLRQVWLFANEIKIELGDTRTTSGENGNKQI